MTNTSSKNKAAQAQFFYAEHSRLEKLGDNDGATENLQKAARLGAAYAISALAYDIYNKFPDRRREAIVLYKKAVRKGDYLSAWNLARHYELAKNVRSYRFWLKKCSSMGMKEAEEELKNPFPYLQRLGVKELQSGDKNAGKQLVEFAARYGNRQAIRTLNKLQASGDHEVVVLDKNNTKTSYIH